MRAVRVSVPGKLILIGEHAVVYSRPALAAAIDRRLLVEIRPRERPGVSLRLPGIEHAEETTWTAIAAHAERTLAAWRRYAEDPSPESFRQVRGEEAAHLVKVALGAARERFGVPREGSEAELPGLELTVTSALAVGSGFGSSAAAAVAVVAAFGAAFGATPAPAEILAAALDVERCQHGRPSGIDTETVLEGGLVWAEASRGRLAFSPLDVASPLLAAIEVYDTGRPRETTGEVVAAVRDVRDRDPHGFERLLDRLDEAARAFRTELERKDGSRARLIELVREAEACLETMGAVPEPIRRLVRQVEAAGGAAKISGAGAVTGDAAGSLLLVAPEAESPSSWPFLARYARRDVALGARGLQWETPA
ncbi:MAG TPA: hypothetical protein VN783_14015 [Thermoanaerobaculia bacterium]|nr:hypothetical protein [Thermoanaerobaculia bacterium]